MEKWSVVRLKEELRRRGARVDGRKADLINRYDGDTLHYRSLITAAQANVSLIVYSIKTRLPAEQAAQPPFITQVLLLLVHLNFSFRQKYSNND